MWSEQDNAHLFMFFSSCWVMGLVFDSSTGLFVTKLTVWWENKTHSLWKSFLLLSSSILHLSKWTELKVFIQMSKSSFLLDKLKEFFFSKIWYLLFKLSCCCSILWAEVFMQTFFGEIMLVLTLKNAFHFAGKYQINSDQLDSMDFELASGFLKLILTKNIFENH